MDLLGEDPKFSMNEESKGRIYSRSSVSPPQYVGRDALISDSIITEGCEIYGTVIRSVLSNDVVVEEGAVVTDSVIMANTHIGKDAKINYAILDENITVETGATVGEAKETAKGIAVIGNGCTVDAGTTVEAGAMISE